MCLLVVGVVGVAARWRFCRRRVGGEHLTLWMFAVMALTSRRWLIAAFKGVPSVGLYMAAGLAALRRQGSHFGL